MTEPEQNAPTGNRAERFRQAEPGTLRGTPEVLPASLFGAVPGAVAGPAAESVTAVQPGGRPKAANDALAKAADEAVRAESRMHTRRAFVGAAVASAAGYGLFRYLDVGPRDEGQPVPLRRAFEANARISRELFETRPLAPTYPLSRAETLRVNGIYGLKLPLEPASWRLQVVGAANTAGHPRAVADVTAWQYRYGAAPGDQDRGHDTKVDPGKQATTPPPPPPGNWQATTDDAGTGRPPRGLEEAGESDSTLERHTPGLLLRLDDVLALPRHELVTQFKCIEGWSQIVHWAGVRMADFLEAYPPARVDGREPRYVYMETPNGDYYTGYDLATMRHPQTLLVTEMMGAPLTQVHGAPLRLHAPTLYGYKQIKCIGLIAYTDEKPDDYWTKLGYDWYAGL